jgi:hypothetical protein
MEWEKILKFSYDAEDMSPSEYRRLYGDGSETDYPPAFDEHGRDYEERGLDEQGKPKPKKDDFLEEMKRLIDRYERLGNMKDGYKRQMRSIEHMLEECQDELEERRQGD